MSIHKMGQTDRQTDRQTHKTNAYHFPLGATSIISIICHGIIKLLLGAVYISGQNTARGAFSVIRLLKQVQ